jgi:hypothetical protein
MVTVSSTHAAPVAEADHFTISSDESSPTDPDIAVRLHLSWLGFTYILAPSEPSFLLYQGALHPFWMVYTLTSWNLGQRCDRF